MKKIGFLSFGHWRDGRGSHVRSAREALAQSVELAVAAEEVGIASAYFRVHHFAEQQSSPFPLLATIGAKTSKLEVGTGVIDMRYENPRYFAEQAASLDLLTNGRVGLGVGRGSPEAAVRGYEHFGHVPADGEEPADMARAHAVASVAALRGQGIAVPTDPHPGGRLLPITPPAPQMHERLMWGAGNLTSARWAASQGMGLMSSTLIIDENGIGFSELQLEQINGFRRAWHDHGWGWTPRVVVVRSISPIVDDLSNAYFRSAAQDEGVGVLGGTAFRYGASYVGEPEELVRQLRGDVAVAAADTVLVTIPNLLGVDFNLAQLTALRAIGDELGWGTTVNSDATSIVSH